MKKAFFDFAKKTKENHQWIRNNPLWKALIPYWSAYKHKSIYAAQSRGFFESNESRVRFVTNLLADEESKKTYSSLIKFRCTGSRKDVPNHGEQNQYFINDFFQYGKDEVLIDCGAFTGDTIEMFLALPNMEYKRIIAFEPDPVNYGILFENYKNNSRIELLNAGVYSSNGRMSFASTKGASSCISDDGDSSIATRNIDSICENREDPITFIKMDVEGAELPALRGAEKTILRDKPRLAICIYHSDNDMASIAEYIHSIVPEYRLYVRQHHRDCLLETVLYAKA